MEFIKEFKKSNETLIDWLSIKFNREIGRYLGSGASGYIYQFGKGKVIKISKRNEFSSKSIIDKHIEGVAKIYSHGKIIVPKKLISYNREISLDGARSINKYNELYYIIMEELFTSNDLEDSIMDISNFVREYVLDEGIGSLKGVPPLKYLFDTINNDEIIQEIYNYSVKVSNIDGINFNEELFAELVVVLRNVNKHFNWVDVHPSQFGRDSKGSLVAFDLDNHKTEVNNFIKNTIRESKDMKHLKLYEEFNSDKILLDFNKQDTLSYNGHLYHGTPIGKLKSILINGFEVNQHREMGFETISLSNNDRMIDMFGNGNGFIFNCDFKKLLKLSDFYYDLFSTDTGMENFEDRGDQELMDKAEELGLKSRFGGYAIDNQRDFIEKYYINNSFFSGSEGIIVPGFDDKHHNAESEIVVLHEGLERLWSCLEGVYIESEYYDIEDMETILDVLKDVDEKDSWDED